MKADQKGFTLIELMIVVAIIGILASVALPAYQKNIKKAAYAEVLTAMNPVKSAITLCYQTQGNTLGNCDSLTKLGVASPSATNAFASLTVGSGAVITATPKAYKGISDTADTCVMTPTASGDALKWAYSGGCVDNGYVKN